MAGHGATQSGLGWLVVEPHREVRMVGCGATQSMLVWLVS